MICLIYTDVGIVANHHGVDAMVPPRLWGRADQLRPRCGRAATAPPRTSAPRADQQLSQDLKIPTKDPQPHVPTVAAEGLISTPIQTIARLQRANCRLDPRVTPPCLAEFHSGLLLLTLSLNVAWLGQARLLYQFHQLALILRRMKAAIERRTSDSTVQSLLPCFISSTRTSLSSAPRGKIA